MSHVIRPLSPKDPGERPLTHPPHPPGRSGRYRWLPSRQPVASTHRIAGMDGDENPLAAIPTEQLVLTLLRELAARVEKLETKPGVGGQENRDSSVPKTRDEEVKNNNASIASQDDAEELSSDYKPPHAAEKNLHVPYGYLLDGEGASIVTRTLNERLNDILVENPLIGELLRQLGGIVQVPADFRFELTNFWTFDGIVQKGLLHGAIEFLDALEQSGGNYWITDYDLKSNVVHYEYGFTPKHSLEVPVVSRSRWDHLERSAPWRRVILIQGLSEMSDHMRYGYLRRYGELTLTYRNPFFSVVSPTDAINMHLGKSFGQAMLLGGGYRFHLSWCRTRRLETNRIRSRQGAAELKVGQLYGSTEQFLCQEAYTIHAIPNNHKYDSMTDELTEDGCADFQKYWTILLLAPLGFYRRGLLKVPRVVSDLDASPLQINMVVLIEDALGAARRAWRGLHQYVEELLGTGTEIFDPELHDSLLSDDELFSGSRKYFWLINSLQTFDNILRQNTEAWTSYRDKFLLPLSRALLNESGVTWKKELDESIGICDRLVEDLERVQKLFRDQRERTLALREGLFSASAVIESRAATRLGENVKLLTYVSIFYLPLAFCTSLWSTTDTFGFNRLAYVTAIVALATYILVFNLNNLVKGAQNSYFRFKGNIVEEMMRERHLAWMETGLKFNRYKPRNTPKEAHPSEWWIFVYQTRKTLQFLRLWRRSESSDGGSLSEKLDDGRSSRRQTGLGNDPSAGRKWSWRFFRSPESRKAAEA